MNSRSTNGFIPLHMASRYYGKHLGHARFDTNSAPPTNAECKDPCHRTKDYHLGRAPNRLRNFDITKGLSTEHTMQVHLESCKLHILCNHNQL